jgi:hypothetical protein
MYDFLLHILGMLWTSFFIMDVHDATPKTAKITPNFSPFVLVYKKNHVKKNLKYFLRTKNLKIQLLLKYLYVIIPSIFFSYDFLLYFKHDLSIS